MQNKINTLEERIISLIESSARMEGRFEELRQVVATKSDLADLRTLIATGARRRWTARQIVALLSVGLAGAGSILAQILTAFVD